MLPLSIPTNDPRIVPRAGGLVLRVVVPVALGLLFAAVLVGDLGVAPERDLQLFAPPGAHPGSTVGLRGLMLDDLAAPGGPTLGAAPVEVALLDDAGARLAQTTLRPARIGGRGGVEGALAVPAAAGGELTLRARIAGAQGAGQPEVRAPLRVGPSPPALSPRPRLSNALQRLAAFPARPVDGGEPPDALELRVVGGACVPETRCELIVRVGRPAAALEVEATPSAEPLDAEPSEPTTGLVRRAVRVHGAEAELRLLARRQGRPVARRTIRLPVVLAVPALRVQGSVLDAGERPRVLAEGTGTEQGVLLDAYEAGVWRRAGSLPNDEQPASRPVPFAALEPGLWRLQAWTGLLADSPASRLVWVRASGEDDAQALRALARESARRGWNDEHAGRVLDGGVDGPATLHASYLLAAGESKVIPRPPASSGAIQGRGRERERSTTWRAAAAIATLLLGIGVAVVLLRRGMRATAQARALLLEAGDEEAASARQRRRAVLSVAGIVSFVLLAFVVAALLLVMREGWLF